MGEEKPVYLDQLDDEFDQKLYQEQLTRIYLDRDELSGLPGSEDYIAYRIDVLNQLFNTKQSVDQSANDPS